MILHIVDRERIATATSTSFARFFGYCYIFVIQGIVYSNTTYCDSNQKVSCINKKYQIIMAIATGVICLSFVLFANGYMVAPSHRLSWHQRQSQGTSAQSSWLLLLLRSTSTDRIEDEFASFAATLEEEPKTTNANVKSWQTDLEQLLLDPKISLAQRQVLISDLMNANAEIRESVNTAIRERKVRW